MVEGILKYFGASFCRLISKIIADFSGCLHFRHAYELGGIGFSANMAWAQIMPFVALLFFEGSNKDAFTTILACSATLWLLLNIVFFRTINKSYYNTFFGAMTAPQYTCKVFLKSKDDATNFEFTFGTRLQYVGERAKRASRSNTHRGNHTAYSNCTICNWQTSRSDALFV